jgi:hypothetical protein
MIFIQFNKLYFTIITHYILMSTFILQFNEIKLFQSIILYFCNY